jgi:GT2 family glycosyltransferase
LVTQTGVSTVLSVIDNSPDEGLVVPDGVELRRNGVNLGFAGAVNEVLTEWLAEEEQRSEFLLVACHDCILPSDDVISSLIDILGNNPRVGIVGPFGPRVNREELEPRVYVSGTCMLIRRECARDVGQFDEQLGTYDEDLDYCLRAWDAGWDVAAVPVGQPTTHGSIAADRIKRISHNHVVLAFKRRRLPGAVIELGLQLRRCGIAAVRGLFGPASSRQRYRSECAQRCIGALGGMAAILRR